MGEEQFVSKAVESGRGKDLADGYYWENRMTLMQFGWWKGLRIHFMCSIVRDLGIIP